MSHDVVEEEWEDRDLSRAIVLGVALGVPLMFAITMLLSALADLALWKSAGVAALPAFFVGPYIGGLATMGAAASKHERRAPVAAEQPPEEERFAA
jgi:hypothetical protein